MLFFVWGWWAGVGGGVWGGCGGGERGGQAAGLYVDFCAEAQPAVCLRWKG